MLVSTFGLFFAPGLSRPCRSSSCVTMSAASESYLAKVPMGPPDAILGIAEAFKASSAPGKVNVAIGAYRDDKGSPWVLPAVRAAEARLLERGENKEYAGIVGLPGFLNVAMRFAYGADCAALDEGRIAATQTLSGTGAPLATYYGQLLTCIMATSSTVHTVAASGTCGRRLPHRRRVLHKLLCNALCNAPCNALYYARRLPHRRRVLQALLWNAPCNAPCVTGACRIAGEFYKRYLPEGTAVYLPDPTWGNHVAIMQVGGSRKQW